MPNYGHSFEAIIAFPAAKNRSLSISEVALVYLLFKSIDEKTPWLVIVKITPIITIKTIKNAIKSTLNCIFVSNKNFQIKKIKLEGRKFLFFNQTFRI